MIYVNKIKFKCILGNYLFSLVAKKLLDTYNVVDKFIDIFSRQLYLHFSINGDNSITSNIV